MIRISVVIPALNEEQALSRLLSHLVSDDAEVIVADGGSADSTREVARKFGARIVESPRGRGVQMNAGAAAARGEALWFLHADSHVPSDWEEQILSALADPAVVGGAFRVRIDTPGLRYRLLDGWGRFRALAQKTFYGDQGIFVRRRLFNALNGFTEWPVLEDLDFSSRMKRAGPVRLLQGPVRTSARRWQSQGWWKTVREHFRLALSYAWTGSPAGWIALVVMAKTPVPGTVKTRLVPPLTPEQAAEIARCLLQETVATVHRVRGVQPVVAVSPDSGINIIQRLLKDPVTLITQGEGDLGARINRVFDKAFSARAKGVIVLGNDHPDLPRAYLEKAARILHRNGDRVVLGPTEDGGYYLIGLTRPHPELFQGIPWSGPEVLRVTRERAEQVGLPVDLLPEWFDLDRPEDLSRLPSRFVLV